MEFEKSRIERLKRDLYSRDIKRIPVEKRTPVQGHESQVPRDWGDKTHVFDMDIPPQAMVKKNKSAFFSSFLGLSLIFFAVALGIAIFIFMGGLNMISSKNVDIKITGPSSISSGEELDADVSVINQNRTDLINSTLYIDYPSGAQTVGTTSVAITHDKINLGSIPSGKNTDYSLRSTFFGEINSVKTITFRFEYTVKGSDAVFSKTKTYDVSIGSSPLILHVTYPHTINSGQPVTLSIDLTSNSNTLLPNALVKVTYPYGFTYTSSNIKVQNNTALYGAWNIGDLQNGDKKTLQVVGTLVGQDSEERSFQVSVGTKSLDSNKDFETQLANETATVSINKSFFNLQAISNGQSTNVATLVGQNTPVTISFQNTLPDNLVDNHIEAVLSGNALDRSSVLVQNSGYFRSLDNTILWDKTTTDTLSQLSPGDMGRVSFSLSSIKDPVAIRSVKNPHIDVAFTMTGTRISNNDSSTVSSSANMTIRLASLFTFSAKSFRAVGSFTNTGPIPPQREVQSTYTVNWTLTNTTNDVANTFVTATMPPNVAWLNESTPSSERINYDPSSRTITWNIGQVAYNTGYSYPPKTVSFKVGVTPSLTDVGSIPVLVTAAHVAGTDTFASSTVSAVSLPVTTRFSDPTFQYGNEIVK